MWWLLPTVVLAGLGELVGWSGRYWSSLNDGTLDKPYIMQYVALKSLLPAFTYLAHSN